MDASTESELKPDETHLKTYVGVLGATAAALFGSWIYWYGLDVDPRLVAGTMILCAFVVLGVVLSVRVSERADMGTWDVGLVLAVVALGPTWASLAVVPAALLVAGRDRLRAAYEIGEGVLIVHLAGMVFSTVSGPLLTAEGADAASTFYGTLAAGVTLVAANEAVNGGLLRVKYGQGFGETWAEIWQPYLASDAVNVLTAGLGVLAFSVYGPVAALVVVGGATGSRVLVGRSREQVEEIRELRRINRSLQEALATSNTTFGTMIVRDLGHKDGFTDRHAAATAVYAADLAREMGMDDARVGRLRLAGLLHNVGLLGLPEELLLATGKPNSIAQSRLAEHPARGEEALAAVPAFGEMASWVRWHHERPDGRGYPDKLRGPWIPAEAKVLAVAQAYAALVLDGPSRPGVGPAEAREKLAAGTDTEFDGVVVRALLRILDTESEGYRMADDHRFVFPAPEGWRATPDARAPAREGRGAGSMPEGRSRG